MSASSITSPLIERKHWLLPLGVLVLTAPLWLGWFEPGLFYFFNAQLMWLPDLFWSFMSLLGTGWAVFALSSPTLWRAPRVIVSWLCAAPLAGVLTRMGKMMADNPRPLEVLDAQAIHVIGEPLYVAAMPSGHTLTAFAAATAIYFSLPPKGRLRFLWLFALATGVGLSRMAVGAHWPADVAIGAVLGMVSGLSGAWLGGRVPARYLQVNSWLLRAVALMGVYSLYVLWTDKMGFEINLPLQYLLGTFLAVCLLFFVSKTVRHV
jgi:membrane-associated phospholipid phosphatase